MDNSCLSISWFLSKHLYFAFLKIARFFQKNKLRIVIYFYILSYFLYSLTILYIFRIKIIKNII